MTTPTLSLSLALLASASLTGCMDAPDPSDGTSTAEEAVTTCPTSHDSAVFPPDAHPYGRSTVAWAESWWRWGLGIPLAQNPNDTVGASPDVGQGGPVYFLPNPPAGSSTTFTIPRHTAIAVILSSVLNDYPCPDPTFQPAPGQSLFDFLLAGAEEADNVASITGTLDGDPLPDLAAYHFTSTRLMTFTGDVSLQGLDPCITGSPQPAAIEAHFMIVKPLAPGVHTLTTHLTTIAGTTRDRTSTLVVPEP